MFTKCTYVRKYNLASTHTRTGTPSHTHALSLSLPMSSSLSLPLSLCLSLGVISLSLSLSHTQRNLHIKVFAFPPAEAEHENYRRKLRDATEHHDIAALREAINDFEIHEVKDSDDDLNKAKHKLGYLKVDKGTL